MPNSTLESDDAAPTKTPAELALDEAAAKLEELRSGDADPESLVVLSDPGGTFAGVFRSPTPEIWALTRAELRTEQGRLVADQNLCTRCMVWPAGKEGTAAMSRAARRRPAIYQMLGNKLGELAGAGQEALVKK